MKCTAAALAEAGCAKGECALRRSSSLLHASLSDALSFMAESGRSCGLRVSINERGCERGCGAGSTRLSLVVCRVAARWAHLSCLSPRLRLPRRCSIVRMACCLCVCLRCCLDRPARAGCDPALSPGVSALDGPARWIQAAAVGPHLASACAARSIAAAGALNRLRLVRTPGAGASRTRGETIARCGGAGKRADGPNRSPMLNRLPALLTPPSSYQCSHHPNWLGNK